MTLARSAGQLEARELDEFQAAARALLSYGLITDRHPYAGALALVRQFEEPLRNEFWRLCHWRLDVGQSCARLLRRPVALSVHRPARTATQSERPFSPQAYASLCLVLAALERLGDQTTISQLADEVVRLRAGDDALPLDLTVHAHRRALVDAVGWLQRLGVLRLIDGDTEQFLGGRGDALYDVDRDASSRLLLSPPSLLGRVESAADFLDDPYPPTAEGEQARARHRVHRRLLTEPALYYDDLPDDERDYARQRRTRVRDELERLTGATLECRAEGQALIGLPGAQPFPSSGAVAQAALLLGSELAVAARDALGSSESHRASVGTGTSPYDEATYSASDRQVGATVGQLVASDEAAAAWRRVFAAYAGRFTAEYRAEPDRLRVEAIALLARLDLVGPRGDGDLLVRPVLARYRAEVRLPETFDV